MNDKTAEELILRITVLKQQVSELEASSAAYLRCIADLEAQLVAVRRDNELLQDDFNRLHRMHLAAARHWTLITEDQTTWPSEHDLILVFEPRSNLEPWITRIWMQQFPSAQTSKSFIGLYWLLVVPPQVNR